MNQPLQSKRQSLRMLVLVAAHAALVCAVFCVATSAGAAARPPLEPVVKLVAEPRGASPALASQDSTGTVVANPNASSSPTVSRCPADAVPIAPKSACDAARPTCLPRTLDEIWFVDTRGLGCPSCDQVPRYCVSRQSCETASWSSATLDELLAADPSIPTVFWVHGNRIDAGYARSQGLSVYRQLTRGVSGELPIRFVIFSWPTGITRGLVRDARQKAVRTNLDGYYLAWLVNQMPPESAVHFIGHSFGARIVTGALHLLGGGVLAGRALPEPVFPRSQAEAVLLAAAVNNDWLAIGRPHGEALAAVDRMLSMKNHCDIALKRYGKIDPCGCPQALGYTGAYGPLGENAYRLYQIDVCCNIGRAHGWESYFYHAGLVARMRPYLGLAP